MDFYKISEILSGVIKDICYWCLGREMGSFGFRCRLFNVVGEIGVMVFWLYCESWESIEGVVEVDGCGNWGLRCLYFDGNCLFRDWWVDGE